MRSFSTRRHSKVRFGGEQVECATSGAPIAKRAAAYLDCKLDRIEELGSHVLVLGEVVGARWAASDKDGAKDFAADRDVSGSSTHPEVLRMEDTRMNYGG